MKIRVSAFVLLLLAGLCRPALAEVVNLEVAPGINARAEFLAGDSGRPLLVFMHGFLQTSQFSTVKRLVEAFSDEGYATLSPNLSLSIDQRVRSLPCEAIHLHKLDDAANELEKWVDWAITRDFDEIVLIGHSAGSISITAYLDRWHQAPVTKTILISLTHFGPDQPGSFETEAMAVKARSALAEGSKQLAQYGLNFCKQYTTTAENFLSYYEWSGDDVLKSLAQSTTRNYIILGGNDQRVEGGWSEQLKTTQSKVIVIDRANHFFDKAHEFDLLDTVERILENGD